MIQLRRLLLPCLFVALSVGVVMAWPDGDSAPDAGPDVPARVAPDRQHAVKVQRPAGAPSIEAGGAAIACSTCHAGKTPQRGTRSTADLDQFHQGLTVAHGGQSCLVCHNPEDYDTLRRADGSALLYEDVMQLCGQCHGPQRRDYDHGAHGGMRGHWDLSRGGRARNGCTDCHDPHAPAYPQVRPVFPPAPDQRHAR